MCDQSHQHCCPKVVLVEKLCYKDVDVQYISHIFLLDVSQNVNEPFEALVAGTYPQKVDLQISFKIDRETSFDQQLKSSSRTFLHATPENLCVDAPCTKSLRMEEYGVTPIPAPIITATSNLYQSWFPPPNGPWKVIKNAIFSPKI